MVGIGAADEVEQCGDVPGLDGHAGDDLLGQDIEAPPGNHEVLDFALEHGATEGRRFQEVGRGLGDQPSPAGPVYHVTGATDPLESSRDVPRRFHLANEVDRPHVDPQFQRCRGHHRRELAALESLLGRPALVQAEAAMVGAERADRVFPLELTLNIGHRGFIEAGGQLLDHPPVVREDDRRAMLGYE